MLLFAHLGLTTGLAKAYEIMSPKKRLAVSNELDSSESPFKASQERESIYDTRITGRLDYRLVMLGSLLPDILDKPLWFFSSGGLFPSGHSYAHTFLFSLLCFIGGLILLRYRKSWLMIISLSSFGHLILDEMWHNPTTLWWPLLGTLPVAETAGWIKGLIYPLFANPGNYIFEILGEILGFIIILLLVCRIIFKKSISSFFRRGVIP